MGRGHLKTEIEMWSPQENKKFETCGEAPVMYNQGNKNRARGGRYILSVDQFNSKILKKRDRKTEVDQVVVMWGEGGV